MLAGARRRMLGNGYCARPVGLDCHFESICESCTFFQTAQAQNMLPDAIAAARDQGHIWAEIGQLLNISQATAARRYRGQS